MAIGRTVGRKAAKATFKHSVRGFAFKAQRKPLRSVSLLTAGGLVGASAGWLAGCKMRSGAPAVRVTPQSWGVAGLDPLGPAEREERA